jgi:hypothetical protein
MALERQRRAAPRRAHRVFKRGRSLRRQGAWSCVHSSPLGCPGKAYGISETPRVEIVDQRLKHRSSRRCGACMRIVRPVRSAKKEALLFKHKREARMGGKHAAASLYSPPVGTHASGACPICMFGSRLWLHVHILHQVLQTRGRDRNEDFSIQITDQQTRSRNHFRVAKMASA